MAFNEVVLNGQTFRIGLIPLLENCHVFQNRPALLAHPYHVRCAVRPEVFGVFVDAIEGHDPRLTDDNVTDLVLLCDEFEFFSLSKKILDYRTQPLRACGSETSSSESQAKDATIQEFPEPPKGWRRFWPTSPTSLEGIIAHLSKQCGGNVHDRHVIAVTGSPQAVDLPRFALRNIVDLTADTFYASTFSPRDSEIPHARNNWICYDFKERRVFPTHYALRSWWDGRVNGPNPKSWIVEISMDGKSWTEVDHQKKNNDLNGQNITKVFPLLENDGCRCIRLVNIGRNHYGDDALYLSGLEIFGCIIDPDEIDTLLMEAKRRLI